MSVIKRNIAANFIGNLWAACMSLVFIPLYIHFMGIEVYGLVGVFVIIQAMSSLLDMGISTTLNRQMARFSVSTDQNQKTRDLLRTLEIIYWSLGLIIAVVIFLAAPYISHKWIQGKQISPDLIEQAIMIMGVAVALQGVAGFYSGGLLGLQKQVFLNVVNIFIATLRGIGAIIVLWLISPTAQAFFIWQVFVSFLQTAILAYSLWQSIPSGNRRTVFKFSVIKEIWNFALGISGITIISVILTQVDKIVLSRIVPLDIFGYYILASTVATGLYRIIGPVFSALYPRFTQLVSLDDQDELRLLYHQSCQLMSVLILPCAAILVFFPREVLFLWKQDPVTIKHAYIILSVLVAGTAINGLMNIPYALQLAYGWTKLAFYLDLAAMLVLVPLIFYLVPIYGAVGAAFIWLIINGFCLFLGIHIMHSHLLKNEERSWWIDDVGKPLAGVMLVSFLGKLFININLPYQGMFAGLTCLFLLSIFVSVICCAYIRNKIFGSLKFYNRFKELMRTVVQ